MRLILVRHGLSIANEGNLVTGTTNDGLSATGIAQAQETKAVLDRIGFVADHHITSQWIRAQQTAQILRPDLKFKIDSRLGETNAGAVAHLPLADFIKEWPDFYSDQSNVYPDGESHDQLNHRVLAWLSETRAACKGTVMAVTHAGPIACLLQHALGLSMDAFPRLKPANASISIIDYADDRASGTVSLFSQLSETSLKALMGSAA